MLLATSVIWGTAFAVQSSAMDYVGPFTFNCIRIILAGVALLPIVLFVRRRPLTKETIIGGLACGTCLCVASAIQQVGLSMTTAGKAGFITALYIVIVPLLGMFAGRRVTGRIWGCVAIATVGFFLLCADTDFSISEGDMLCLICALFFSFHILTIDYFGRKNADGITMSCIQFFVAGILSAAPMFAIEAPAIGDILNAKGQIFYAGVMSGGVGYTLQILGQKRTDPASATLVLSLESVFAALSGWIMLKQGLTIRELAGCALVFAAVLLAQTPEKEADMNGIFEQNDEKSRPR